MGYHLHACAAALSELVGYTRRADELLTRAEQEAVVDLLAYDPACGDLIPGTGGLRKVRIGRAGSGKRGGARVTYYFHSEDIPLLQMALYAKSEKADLSERDREELARFAKEFIAQWRGR